LRLDAVRGLEGDAAKAYFDVFDGMITAQKEDFFFRARSRRPPLDSPAARTTFRLAYHRSLAAA
jgi:CRISPR-associated protein Cas1